MPAAGCFTYDPRVEDLELRSLIYRHVAEHGTAPSRTELTDATGEPEVLDEVLQRLHDGHMIVLDDRAGHRGEIRMALPFSAEPTGFQVESIGGGRRWWANCAWDSLAIPAALHDDVRIASTWHDTGQPAEFRVVDGRLDDADGFIGFEVPARHWWDDIVET